MTTAPATTVLGQLVCNVADDDIKSFVIDMQLSPQDTIARPNTKDMITKLSKLSPTTSLPAETIAESMGEIMKMISAAKTATKPTADPGVGQVLIRQDEENKFPYKATLRRLNEEQDRLKAEDASAKAAKTASKIQTIIQIATAGHVPIEAVMEINVAYFFNEVQRESMATRLDCATCVVDRIRINNAIVLSAYPIEWQERHGAEVLNSHAPLYYPHQKLAVLNAQILSEYSATGAGPSEGSVFSPKGAGQEHWLLVQQAENGAYYTDATPIAEAIQAQDGRISRIEATRGRQQRAPQRYTRTRASYAPQQYRRAPNQRRYPRGGEGEEEAEGGEAPPQAPPKMAAEDWKTLPDNIKAYVTKLRRSRF